MSLNLWFILKLILWRVSVRFSKSRVQWRKPRNSTSPQLHLLDFGSGTGTLQSWMIYDFIIIIWLFFTHVFSAGFGHLMIWFSPQVAACNCMLISVWACSWRNTKYFQMSGRFQFRMICIPGSVPAFQVVDCSWFLLQSSLMHRLYDRVLDHSGLRLKLRLFPNQSHHYP